MLSSFAHMWPCLPPYAQVLKLTGNPVEDLPDELGGLLALEVLDVEQHKLVPMRSRGWLAHLKQEAAAEDE